MRTHLWRLASVVMLLALLLSPLASAGNVSAAPSSEQSAQTDSSIQVEGALTQKFETQGSAGYLIYFSSKTDLTAASKMNWDERGQFVMETLQKAALDKQANVRAYLDAQGVEYQSFWIDNVIAVDSSTSQVFNGLMAFPEIQSLKARRTMGVIEPERQPAAEHLFAIESNLTHINADDVWTMGYEGQGITIANIDTGVRYTHQAVNAQYRGNLGGGVYEHNYNWFDPYGDHPTTPADDNGHGTHTMGTMVGDDGSTNQTGVAPSADWMACRACNTSDCTDTALLACAQFITAPTDLAGANPDPAKRPVAVNNSWGDCSTTYDNWYQGVVDAWQAAGIFPIFSNGNASNCGYSSPPGLNTVGNPARYGNVTGVGSSGQNNGLYATHSNWGPTDNLDTINPSPADSFGAALKPQVIAPGVNIRSSVNTSDSSYESWAGTSMSAPHVTGLVALIVEAAPCLAGEYATIETILEDTAVAIPYSTGGSPAPPAGNAVNYATGHGEIDALAAVNMALGLCGESILSGTVTSSATGSPIDGATVDIVNLTTNRHTTTNAAGFYTANLFDGTYDLTFSKYGYITQTINGVNLVGTATQNAALVTAPISTISGVVTDAAAGWPVYARIDIAGYPGGPIFTNPITGAYSVNLIDASYTFTVSAMSGGYTNSVAPLVVAGNATENFTLAVNAAICTAPGYHIVPGTAISSDGFDTSTAPAFSANWASVDVSGTTGDWITRITSIHPTGITPHSAPNMAVFNSYTAPATNSTRLYQTSGLDLSAQTSGEVSFWMYHENGYTLLDSVQVLVSTDGGATWNNVGAAVTRPGTPGWAKHTINIDAYTGAGMSDVRVGFLATSAYGNDIHIDDISIATATVCAPIASTGLVIGSVFDANTSLLITGASVQDAALNTALVIDASADPATPDQMYVIAEPAGAVSLTASATGYGSDTQSPTVVAGSTIGQNFNLASASIAYAPLTLQATLQAGDSVITPFTLTNNGGQAATFELVERNGGFTPGSVLTEPRTVTKAAGAHLPSARSGPSEAGFSAPIQSISPAAVLFSEGFEGGVVPPTGWTEVVNNASYNWKITTTGTPYAGSEAADVEYDDTLAQQNEWLLSPELVLSEGILSFWSNGSVYWCRDTYDNCDLNVWIVVGNVGGGDDILVGKGDDSWPANWTWAQSTFNLTPLLPGGPVRIGFQYVGSDGAQVVLDEVVLDGTEGSLDIPWLSVSPATGNIPASGNQVVNVTFDASALTNVGQYDATLRILSNDPIHPSIAVPVTLNVVVDPSARTVTFNANGGTGTMAPQVSSVPAALSTNTFTRAGYTFSGWNTVADGSGTAYANGATYDFAANITLYAQWTINTYTVTFDANGGTGTMTPQVSSVPAALTLNTFTRAGYTFSGWNTVAGGSGTAYADGATYNFAADITLYAQWTINAHTVTFDANGGTGTMTPQVSSVPAALTLNTFTRVGYTFSGWNTAADGSGTAYANGATYSFAADITLYALWTALTGPDKIAPADTAVGVSLNPTLSWNQLVGATSYEYCYSSVAGPCTKWNSVSSDTSVTLSGLAPNYTYYWQVRAVNPGGTTEADGGTWWSFTTTTVSACTWPAYTPPTSATFGDVPMTVGHWSWVERLANSTITAGCGAGNYCPFSEVNRAQMAIFLLRGKHCGSSYIPPAVGATTGFADVPLDATYAPWVKQLAAEGVTAGCGNGNFCPLQVVNRAQMAIFLLRAKHGSTYSPPAVGATTGFGDVPLDATYAAWVKQLAAEGVTAGCGNGNFCPLQNVNRAQMATFLVRAFGLP